MSDFITIPLSTTGKNAGMYEAIIDKIDSELEAYNWTIQKKPRTVYVKRHVTLYNSNKKQDVIQLHREVMERKLERKLERHEDVDHIDGNGLNNRRDNLRLANRSQNGANRKIGKNNSSGVKGVYWYKPRNCWRARIGVNGKEISLGHFKNIDDAKQAYKEAALLYFGEYASEG